MKRHLSLRFVSLLVLALAFLALPGLALASDPPNSAPKPAASAPADTAAPAVPALTSTDLDALTAVTELRRATQTDLQTARFYAEATQARDELAQAREENAKLRILATHRLSPDEYDVVPKEVERDGKRLAEWTIVKKEPPLPPKP